MHTPIARNAFVALSVALALASASAAGRDDRPQEPLVGLPCEGCEAAFDGLPAEVPTELVLWKKTTPGVPMTVDGRIIDAVGNPRPDVLIYLHQTDSTGIYPAGAQTEGLGREARRHGRLRGWVRSDSEGRYRIVTIRPGSYPGADIPEHIHMQVIEPGCATYLVDDLLFRDDSKLTPDQERQLARGTGGLGVVMPRRSPAGWEVTRDVVLGAGVPGYPECGAGR
ncbi:hypothetical protein [uncultured Aquimonas sp.]|uniref:dioxygenase family protein n=1 Tax=uncultured Aquimonas sp. TaxID=385483 RepID=UPI002632D35F|nr:hypothetical protein [uncultured Aquimonas sp.]